MGDLILSIGTWYNDEGGKGAAKDRKLSRLSGTDFAERLTSGQGTSSARKKETVFHIELIPQQKRAINFPEEVLILLAESSQKTFRGLLFFFKYPA